MKTMVKAVNGKKVIIPSGKLAGGDWFKCEKCGREVRMLVLGNTATCSECGGRMVRT